MEKLTHPDKALRLRLLNKVGFEERMVGYQVGPRAGPTVKNMYSFKEVINFLKEKYLQLRFDELEEWLRNVINDHELALQVSKIVNQEKNDHDRIQNIRIIMEERLRQCRTQSS